MKDGKPLGTTWTPLWEGRGLTGKQREHQTRRQSQELLPEESGEQKALERAHGALSVPFKHLKKMIFLRRAWKKDGEWLLTQAAHDRTRGNGLKGEEGRFRRNVKN